jgi:hypothetical protein
MSDRRVGKGAPRRKRSPHESFVGAPCPRVGGQRQLGGERVGTACKRAPLPTLQSAKEVIE